MASPAATSTYESLHQRLLEIGMRRSLPPSAATPGTRESSARKRKRAPSPAGTIVSQTVSRAISSSSSSCSSCSSSSLSTRDEREERESGTGSTREREHSEREELLSGPENSEDELSEHEELHSGPENSEDEHSEHSEHSESLSRENRGDLTTGQVGNSVDSPITQRGVEKNQRSRRRLVDLNAVLAKAIALPAEADRACAEAQSPLVRRLHVEVLSVIWRCPDLWDPLYGLPLLRAFAKYEGFTEEELAMLRDEELKAALVCYGDGATFHCSYSELEKFLPKDRHSPEEYRDCTDARVWKAWMQEVDPELDNFGAYRIYAFGYFWEVDRQKKFEWLRRHFDPTRAASGGRRTNSFASGFCSDFRETFVKVEETELCPLCPGAILSTLFRLRLLSFELPLGIIKSKRNPLIAFKERFTPDESHDLIELHGVDFVLDRYAQVLGNIANFDENLNNLDLQLLGVYAMIKESIEPHAYTQEEKRGMLTARLSQPDYFNSVGSPFHGVFYHAFLAALKGWLF